MLLCSLDLNLASNDVLAHSLWSVGSAFRQSAIVLGLVLLVSCDTGGVSEGSVGSTIPSTTTRTEVTIENPVAVEKLDAVVPAALTVLERSTVFGELFDPSSLAGREVLLWFWAPW